MQPRSTIKKRKPIISLERLSEALSSLNRRMREYALTKRGRSAIDDTTLERLKTRAAGSLYATNARARIECAKAVDRAFRKLTQEKGYDEFFFVTLTPKRFAVRASEAVNFDHETIKNWVKEVLAGFNYVGMVDAALYTNINVVPGYRDEMVSWHIHAIVWGCTEHRIRAVEADIDSSHDALIPGRVVAMVNCWRATGAAGRLVYLFKGIVSEYRVFEKKQETTDPCTGEITPVGTGVFRQKKRDLRPGNAAKMMKIIGERTLPMLAISGGQGNAVLQRAWARALAVIAREDRAFARKLERLLAPKPERPSSSDRW